MAETSGKVKSMTTNEVALMFGVTARYIRQLTEDGIIKGKVAGNQRKYDRDETVQAYIAHIKASASKPTSKNDAENESRRLAAEADLKETKAAIEKIKHAELEGQMHRSEDVEAVLADLIYEVKNRLMALPGRLAMDTARIKTPEEESIRINAEVKEILNSLADYRYDPEKFQRRVKARKGADEDAAEETDD